jgi:hypothetical protein
MITALGPRLGLGLRLDFGSQVWFVQYFSEKKVIVSPGSCLFFFRLSFPSPSAREMS